MNELDRDLVFSQAVKAGKRIYYFDVKQSRNGDRYISITESKKIVDGPAENPHFTFEKHKLFLYKEDYEKFVDALMTTLDVAKTGVVPQSEEEPENADATLQHSFSVNSESAEAISNNATEETASETPASEPKAESDSFKIDLDF